EITQSYYLGKFEITQGEWKRVMGDNPSRFNKCGSECPVESVSWDEVQAFLKRLNQMEGGEVFRLPTEAEWEMAARAGTKTAYFFGDNPKELKKHAWFDGNSVGGIAKVGLKKANSWGLYDMHGNVSEWVSDWFSIYGSEALKDPGGPSGGSKKVVRGGCWYDDPSNCRSAFRVGKEPSAKNGYQGFRILRTTKDLLEKQKKKSAKKELKKDVSKKRMSLHKKK
ncbi:formylglycine-generating enzyme family protein, partial [bacterium]|nr:formylglycine-generating enzyme family protein [bacterium]